jgi:hypothetical protein
MTLTQMRAEVYTRLGEQAGFYTDANLTQWLNDGMDDIAIRLEPKVTSSTLTTTASQIEYPLPDNLISIKTALYKDTNATPDAWVDLKEVTYLELFRMNADWEADTTPLVPTMWYWRPEYVIGLYPKIVAGTTDGLRIIYTCRPDEMVDDTDTTTMPNYLDRTVVLYAVMRARLKDRDDQRAIVARAEWEKSVDMGSLIINKHRKEHAPRVEPRQTAYRTWWYNRTPRFRAISGS